MSEKAAVMTIEELVQTTKNLGNTITGLPSMFVGVSNHLAVVGEVISRLKAENDALHLKVKELEQRDTVLYAPGTAIAAYPAFWPEVSFGGLNDFIFNMIKDAVMSGTLSISGGGHHSNITLSRATKAAPQWDALTTDMAIANAKCNFYRYGFVNEEDQSGTYFFGLTIKDILAKDLVFDVMINDSCLEVIACIGNEAGDSYTYTPMDVFAFTNIIRDADKGVYDRVRTLLGSVLSPAVSAELMAPPTPPAPAKDVQQPSADDVMMENNIKYGKLISALTSHYAKQFGRMRVHVDSVVNSNANDPSEWDRDILLHAQTGCYNRSVGEVLLRYRLDDNEDLVVVSAIGSDDCIKVGFFKVDPVSKLITPIAESVAKDLLKEILV